MFLMVSGQDPESYGSVGMFSLPASAPAETSFPFPVHHDRTLISVPPPPLHPFVHKVKLLSCICQRNGNNNNKICDNRISILYHLSPDRIVPMYAVHLIRSRMQAYS
jgi:hypothetical protein